MKIEDFAQFSHSCKLSCFYGMFVTYYRISLFFYSEAIERLK